jgi:hypothetical protein
MHCSKRPSVLLAALGLVLAVTVPALAGGYRYLSRDKLQHELADWVGKKVTFTDRLVKVYADPVGGHLLFDTHKVRCAVPVSTDEGVELLRSILGTALKRFDDLGDEFKAARTAAERAVIAEKLFKRWKGKAVVTLFGTVARPEIWGPVDDPSRGDGVVSERVVFVVERAEKPRKRWFEEIR